MKLPIAYVIGKPLKFLVSEKSLRITETSNEKISIAPVSCPNENIF